MKYKVKDIGENGVDVDLPLTSAWLAQECAELELSPGEGLGFKGQLSSTGEDYLLRGRLRGTVKMPCARCLEPARLLLDSELSVIYVEREGELQEDEADDDLNAPDVVPFQDGIINIGPELRDELMLAVPVSVLCREDCLGLCAVCGGNRNENPCDCVERQRQSESKFAALAKLKS